MPRRIAPLVGFASLVLVVLWVIPAFSATAPSGQRMTANTSFDPGTSPAAPPFTGKFVGGGGTVEPAIDAANGNLVYLLTPNNAQAHPNAHNVAPLYLTMYPTGSVDPASLNCAHQPADNCPDHGPAVSFLAAAFESGVYGNGVAGHDHLVGIASTGGDFNVLWVPTLVLFKHTEDVVRITTLAQLQALGNKVDVIPLDGTGQASFLPNLTFHCSVVSAAVYNKAALAPTVGP